MIKVLKYLKEMKGSAALAMIFVLFAQISTLTLPLLMSLIINNGIANADLDYIKKVGIIMACVSALHVFISVFSSYFTSKTSCLYAKILRESIFLKVESLSQSDIDKIGTPSLITRSTSDVKVLQDFVLQGLRIIIAIPIMLVGGSFMAFFLNPKLASIIFAIIPVICIIAFVVVKTVMPLFKKRQKLTDEVNRFLRQKLSGIRVIRAFNTSDYEDDSFSEKNNKLSYLILKFQRIMAVLIPLCIVIVVVTLDFLIFIATKNIEALSDIAKIQSTVGDLQAFVVYMIMVIGAISMAAAMFVIVPRANISAKRINEIMALEPEIKDAEEPAAPKDEMGGEIQFKNVSFSYGAGQENTLKDISFTAKKGKVTAIIGSTGSGKSTVASLIARFYDIDEGEILFDGVNIKNISQNSLHERIGYVPQKAFLFSGSIEDNLRFGNENASDERIKLALDISQSSEFVNLLPKKEKSFVSQSGTNLSGGQKQRLAIARALTRDAQLYIFDDSFSALDFITDARLRKALKENIDATVLIIAQRIGTILDADNIIVLDEGKIVGQGRHEELMKTCEIYKEIARSQLSKEVLADEN